MMELLKSLWATMQDGSQRTSARIGALFGLSALFAIPIAVLVVLVKFAHSAFSAMGISFLLICLWAAERIYGVIERNRQEAQRQMVAQQQMDNVISRRIAIAIIPAISQVVSMDLEPEDITYDLGVMPFGTGFYYATPRLLSEDEVRRLRRLIVMKLHGRIQVSRTDIGREGIVIVGKDCIFIRNDPRVIQYFTTND